MKTIEIQANNQLQHRIQNPLKLVKKLLTLKGSPKSISMGYAMGVFMGTTPFIGLKVFIAILIASLFRWNKLAASIGVLIINPLTGPFFHGLAYVVGKNLLGFETAATLEAGFNMDVLKSILYQGNDILMSLLFGGFVLGVPMAFIAYHASYKVLSHKLPVSAYDFRSGEKDVFTLITGASAGLGKQMAIQCARRGMNLILVALPGTYLKDLCRQLEEEYKIRTVCFETDLTKKTTIQNMVYHIRRKCRINMLINNAGIGCADCFEDSPTQSIENMIMLNIRALSMLTRLLIPELKTHEKAYILNVASMAAFSPMPYKSIYPASKAFVYSFSRSLREELKGMGIQVSVVNPGPIMTNPAVAERIKNQGFLGKIGLVSASKISEIALNAMFNGKSVIVPGLLNKFNLLLIRILPYSIRMLILSSVFKKGVKQKTLKKAS